MLFSWIWLCATCILDQSISISNQISDMLIFVVSNEVVQSKARNAGVN